MPIQAGGQGPQGEQGLTRVYDPDENRTRVWNPKGFQGYENGNTEKFSSKGNPDVEGTVRDSKGNIDPERTARNVALNAIPAAITAALPESKALSPLMNIMKRFGIGTAGTSVADQLMNLIPGMDQKPLLNSVVGAAGTNLGASIPELANQALGLRLGPKINTSTTTSDPTITETIGNIINEIQSRRTTTGKTTGTGSSTGSGTSSGGYESNTEGISGVPNSETRITQGRDAAGRFMAAEENEVQIPGFKNQSTTTGTRSGQSGSENHYQNMTDIINEAIQNATSKGQRTGTSTTTPGQSTTTSTGSWPGPLGILQSLKLQNPAVPKPGAAGLGFLLNSLADQMSGNNQRQ